jgi:hypothetical protein
METVFPTEDGYAGFFLVGWRMNPVNAIEIQQVGSVVLKRSYNVSPHTDPELGMLTPATEPLPVFEQDVPENLALNGDMEASQQAFGEGDSEALPGAWQAEPGAIAALAAGEGREGGNDTALRITGSANSRVVQTILFDEPLGGRSYTLSIHARADANTSINGVQLEADGASPICVLNRVLTTAYGRHTATGSWPAGVEATEMRVVLRMAPSAVRTVFYDDVEVLERGYSTKVNVVALRYESDLAPYKPEGDVVVLDYAAEAGLNRVRVDGSSWLARMVTTNGSGQDKALFGWQARNVDPRKREAAFPDEDSAYPLPQALPEDFDNRFYNGYLRPSLQLAALPYFAPSAAVEIERDGNVDYAFRLNGEMVTASYFTYSGIGPDQESRWQRRSVPMNLDTLVIEPEHDRCYAVWRGAWNYDDHPEDAYRRLVVAAG